ncbi:MAG: hypothetical protein SVU32_06445 [Candidatus Nanohaloarchaea archaeon]|nr:hypothetical protein [Candidatus Nanohaloarchaea archaeon]
MEEQFRATFNALFDRLYTHYEKMLILPALLLLATFLILGYSMATTGKILDKSIEFEGGAEMKIPVQPGVTQDEVDQVFTQALGEVNVRTLSSGRDSKWILVETKQNIDQERALQLLQQAGINPTGEISIQTVGAAVSESFLFEAQLAFLIAFLIMSAVIFAAFRTIVPSLAVILAAFTDIIVAVAGMNLLGIQLGLGSLAALLMLIGYSVDTDIVLSTRILKQSGDLKERVRDSITTGMTMTLAAIVAFTVLFLMSTSPTLDEIAAVILLGLLADIPATWTGNAVILKMHSEGRI